MDKIEIGEYLNLLTNVAPIVVLSTLLSTRILRTLSWLSNKDLSISICKRSSIIVIPPPPDWIEAFTSLLADTKLFLLVVVRLVILTYLGASPLTSLIDPKISCFILLIDY
jgi:hypothetical protein